MFFPLLLVFFTLASPTQAVAEPVLGASGSAATNRLVAQMQERVDAKQADLLEARDRASALQLQATVFRALDKLQTRTLIAATVSLLLPEPPARLALRADDSLNQSLKSSESLIASVGASQRQLAAFQLAVSQEARRNALLTSDAIRSGHPEGTRAPAAYGWGGDFTHAVTAATLNRYLKNHGSPMAGTGAALIRAGTKWNIDPRLIVAIAGAESNFGQITCASYNAWGWACPRAPARFASWDDAIDTVTHGLRSNYIDHGLTTVSAIQRSYAPSHAKNDPNGLNLLWSLNVSEFLVEQGGNPANVQGSKIATGLTGVD